MFLHVFQSKQNVVFSLSTSHVTVTVGADSDALDF